MRSFEYDYLLEAPISHTQGMTLRTLGEYRGRQAIYAEQSPEVLETLRKVAMVQSTESSNRIEGITVGPGRVDRIVMKKAEPRDRPEQEVAGYRDVLADIHTNHRRMMLSADLIRGWHRMPYRWPFAGKVQNRGSPASLPRRKLPDPSESAFGHAQGGQN